MELKKAIEILKELVNDSSSYMENDENEAANLGIEAMKRIRSSRDPRFPIQGQKLPGETEE